MRRLALFASISALVLAVLPLAPAQAVSEAAAGAIPGSYIVVLNDGEPGAVAAEHSRRHNSSVTHVYRHALRGYSARMSEQAAANVARDGRVAYVEQDGVVTTAEVGSWGLDRIDQRELPLSSTFTPDGDGAGVRAYVLDTGIRATHDEFEGRVASGYTAIDDRHGTDDCQGHGTHVAGTIGGITYGVAKGVTLVPVRVLNCRGSGSWSGVIAGIEYVTNRDDRAHAVANMSLTGGKSQAVNDAVIASIASGVVYALAAGNNGADACSYSPASTPAALTVGATTDSDARASYSNYGTCLDVFAPGSSIKSANYTGGSSVKSGTSMAAPHVAGVAALLLQDGMSASAATDAVVTTATAGTVTGAGTGSPTLLLFTAPPTGGTDPDPVNNPPTAAFTASCPTDGLTCSFTDTSTDDGVLTWLWTFGDGGQSTQQNPTHTYAATGTVTVTLTVTDAANQTDSASETMTVGSPPPSSITLTATNGPKVKGTTTVHLAWSGAQGLAVTIHRNGTVLTETANDDTYDDPIKGGGSYTYKVCEVGTTTCSAEQTVTF